MNNTGFFSRYCAFFSLIFRCIPVTAGGFWEMSVALITSVLLFDRFRPDYNKHYNFGSSGWRWNQNISSSIVLNTWFLSILCWTYWLQANSWRHYLWRDFNPFFALGKNYSEEHSGCRFYQSE